MTDGVQALWEKVNGIDEIPAGANFEVQVRASREASHSHPTDHVALFHLLSDIDVETGKVGVGRLQAIEMVDEDDVAKRTDVLRVNHHPVLGCLDRSPIGRADIDTAMEVTELLPPTEP
jgi:hypothetical protein